MFVSTAIDNQTILMMHNNFGKFILVLLALILSVSSAHAFIDSYVISRDKLPEAARQMLEELPKGQGKSDKDRPSSAQEGRLRRQPHQRHQHTLQQQGQVEIRRLRPSRCPRKIVPKKIRTYVADNYPEVTIVSITAGGSDYEIGLSNQVKLKFNLLGKFKSVVMNHE